MKAITSGMHALAKCDFNYNSYLHPLSSSYKLNACDDGSTLVNAWDILMAGFGSIGSEHVKMHEDLNSAAEGFEKWRKKETEEKKKVSNDGAAHIRELAVYESNHAKAKTKYIQSAKNLELAIQKRDEALGDPKLKDNILRLSAKVKLFNIYIYIYI